MRKSHFQLTTNKTAKKSAFLSSPRNVGIFFLCAFPLENLFFFLHTQKTHFFRSYHGNLQGNNKMCLVQKKPAQKKMTHMRFFFFAYTMSTSIMFMCRHLLFRFFYFDFILFFFEKLYQFPNNPIDPVCHTLAILNARSLLFLTFQYEKII